MHSLTDTNHPTKKDMESLTLNISGLNVSGIVLQFLGQLAQPLHPFLQGCDLCVAFLHASCGPGQLIIQCCQADAVVGQVTSEARGICVMHIPISESKSRVPNQNGISQACYIVEIYHSSPELSKCDLSFVGPESTSGISLH